MDDIDLMMRWKELAETTEDEVTVHHGECVHWRSATDTITRVEGSFKIRRRVRVHPAPFNVRLEYRSPDFYSKDDDEG
jgi:hypothetical protein